VSQIRKAGLVALVLVIAVPMTAHTRALPEGDAPVNVVATGPGAQFHTYAPPVVVVEKRGTLTYANFDIARHDFVQDTKADGVSGPRKKPWCKSFKKRKCPVFWTPTIGVGQQVPVRGLESVKPGASYTFLCTLHPGMSGTLVVTP
jgi:plastocyanin